MWKIVKRFTRKDVILISISILSMITSVGFDLFQPILFGRLSVLLTQDQAWNDSYSIIIGIMAGAAIMGVATNLLAIFLAIRTTVHLSNRLRNDMFNHVQYLASCDIDKISTSSIINRINNDVNRIEQFLFILFTMSVKAPAYFVGGLTLSIISLFVPLAGENEFPGSHNIAYIYILFPVLSVFTAFVLYKTFPIFDKIKINLDENNAVMSENLIGSRVVRAFNLEKNQISRYEGKISTLRKNTIKAENIVNILLPVFTLCMNFSILFIIAYSGDIASKLDPTGEVQKEDILPVVTSIIQYFNILMVAFFLSGFVLATYSTTRISARRINEIYATESSIKEITNPKAITKNNISFKNVWFKYFEDSEDWALEDLSFDIKEGETIGVIGQTGCGKSTIVNLITRLYDVSKGEIIIGDSNIKEIKIEELRKKIAVSLQEKILFSKSIEDNIKVGKQDATFEEVKAAAIMAEAYDFIQEKEGQFQSKIEERGRNLSGGQKQRVSIARALIARPEILIFDDSTSALDNITEKKLLGNIKKGLKGSTLIIIAQRINSIKDADKIIVLSDGKLIGMGSHSQLMKNNEIYQSIYRSQDTSKD
ncbi:MAG: ABC transporter ATP-binding protein [Mycoplasmoidaceae bacterium]